MKKRCAIACGFAAFAAVLTAGDAALQPVPDPQPILQDLQRKMASLGSTFLDFSQERHLKLFSEPLKSQGAMLIEKPDRIRWETTEPFQSILLADRKSVAQFERTDGQWQKLKLGFPQMLRRVMDQMVLMHQGRLDALTSDYTLSVATGHVAVVKLVPKDESIRSVLASLEIHLAPDLSGTREVVMNEPSGDFTRIVFLREWRDVKFPPRTFDQTKPLELSAVRAALDNAR
jgi:outer membrane lipoprotein-sorting protein